MWAEGPPEGSSWHTQCVSRKLAIGLNYFAGKNVSQILNHCPSLYAVPIVKQKFLQGA